jgi:hypothetical protein
MEFLPGGGQPTALRGMPLDSDLYTSNFVPGTAKTVNRNDRRPH